MNYKDMQKFMNDSNALSIIKITALMELQNVQNAEESIAKNAMIQRLRYGNLDELAGRIMRLIIVMPNIKDAASLYEAGGETLIASAESNIIQTTTSAMQNVLNWEYLS